ncbi:MAG: hypothetical protein ACK40K_04540, partial [Raineya sp.]
MPKILLYCLFFWIFFISCRPQNELFTDNPETLRFSEEAIVFDTILAGVPTATKRLRVFNPNKKAVRINEVFLGSGSQENYSLLLNAQEGITFKDVSLLGGD